MQTQFTTIDQVIDALIAKSNVLGMDKWMACGHQNAREVLHDIVWGTCGLDASTITKAEFDEAYRIAMKQYEIKARFF